MSDTSRDRSNALDRSVDVTATEIETFTVREPSVEDVFVKHTEAQKRCARFIHSVGSFDESNRIHSDRSLTVDAILWSGLVDSSTGSTPLVVEDRSFRRCFERY